MGGRSATLTNFFTHRLAGLEFAAPPKAHANRFISAVRDADILHVHASHSYFAPLPWLIDTLEELGKPVVWTAHDFWLLTGRCAFLEGCFNWRHGCGACPTMTNYPPALIDLSRTQFKKKQALLARIRHLMHVACPTEFVSQLMREAFPEDRVVTITNGLDSEFETALHESRAHLDPAHPAASAQYEAGQASKLSIAIVANDLSDPTKVNPALVHALLESGKVHLQTVGKRSPFHGANVTNNGHLDSRAELVGILTGADYLLFSSLKDTFGLVMAESLACGTPVLAVESDASREVLALVGAKPFPTYEDILTAVESGLAGRPTPAERLSNQAAAKEVFFSSRVYKQYIGLYEKAVADSHKETPA